MMRGSHDLLGTTVGAKSGATYTAAALSAFGEDLNHHSPTPTSNSHSFYTGKPHVPGLGYAFLMRNYRAGLAKWQTADPMGYPDGWNALAYCNNGVTGAVDLWGCEKVLPDGGDTRWAPFDALALAVSVKWDCKHNFDNPSFSSRISTSGDTGEITIDYKSDTNAILKFSAIKVKDTATFLPGISTSFDHAWKLLVEIEVYVTIAYLDSNGSVQVDQFLNRRLLFDTVHWISKMWE